jgi:hypothetical protein
MLRRVQPGTVHAPVGGNAHCWQECWLGRVGPLPFGIECPASTSHAHCLCGCACRFGALRQWQLQEATLSIAAPPLYGLLRYRRLEDAVAAYNALNKRVRV